MTKDLQNIRCRRFSSNTLNQIHKRYRRPKVRCAASSVHVTLREQLLRVAAESGFHIFTMSKTANHVRVTSTDMPYHGANFHGRGLKIRLCGLTVSTGALNAVEIYAKKEKNSFGRCSRPLENERSTVLNAEPKPRSSQSTLTGKKIRTSLGSSCAEQIHVPPPPVTVYPKYFPHFRLAWGPSSS